MPFSSEPVRCPFPSCGDRDASHSPLPGGISRCEHCLRLAVQCSDAACPALNRPFSRHCRRCGINLFSTSRGTTLEQRWREVERFQDRWLLQLPAADDPVPLADLRHAAGYRSPEVLLEWTFADGLLALHQGGGFMALLHPFQPADDSLASNPLWSHAEAQSLRIPEARYEAERFRPYPPTLARDRRYLLFSTPYAAFALDLYSLPGWTVDGRHADVRVLADFSSRPELRLAAAPIPLSESPSTAGMVIHNENSGEYFWWLCRLGDRQEGGTALAQLDRWQRLPVRGSRCQCALVADHVIAFSTDREHWLWPREDASCADLHSLCRTWPVEGASEYLRLDQHVMHRGFFSWPRQHFYLAHGHDPSGERPHGFEWCYQHSDQEQGNYQFQSYYVQLDNLAPRLPVTPAQWASALPIGQCRLPNTDLAQMLFIGGDQGGELYRRMPGVPQLSPTQYLTVSRNEIDGLSLRDPLLMILSGSAGGKGLRRVSLYTLRDPTEPAIWDDLELAADPLIWSRWLFTCERVGTGLRVHRREIPVQDEETAEGI